MNDLQYLTHSLENSILFLTISRPKALNALNSGTLDELEVMLQEIHQNETIRGVILTGEGEKAFVAGADIKELAALNQEESLILAQRGQKIFRNIEHSPKPFLAAINGFALGGGCELAMSCHVRIAVESARLGQPEINLGIIPGYGGTQRLAQLTGRGKAFELLMTGDLIDAREALRIGLVNHVTSSHEELLNMSRTIMSKIVEKSPLAIRRLISAVNAGFSFESDGYTAEAVNFAVCTTTKDFKEGTSAFLEKRRPVFKGE